MFTGGNDLDFDPWLFWFGGFEHHLFGPVRLSLFVGLNITGGPVRRGMGDILLIGHLHRKKPAVLRKVGFYRECCDWLSELRFPSKAAGWLIGSLADCVVVGRSVATESAARGHVFVE